MNFRSAGTIVVLETTSAGVRDDPHRRVLASDTALRLPGADRSRMGRVR